MQQQIDADVLRSFAEPLAVRQGRVAPSIGLVPFDNTVLVDATVMFLDLRDSTELVENHDPASVVRLYKAYHKAAVRVIRAHDGEVRGISGDGLMAVFCGGSSRWDAVRSALKIKRVITEVLPRVSGQKASRIHVEPGCLDFGIGVDSGKLLVAKVGFQGENNRELVWIGESTNRAASLAKAARRPYNIAITKRIYTDVNGLHRQNGSSVWLPPNEPPAMGTELIYSTDCDMAL